MYNEKIGQFISELRKSKQMTQKDLDIFAIAFSITLLLGIIVCGIVDMAINGTFTWSLYPISSIVFAWLVFFSVIKFGKKGVFISLLMLSIFITPFLYVLNNLIKTNNMILPVGIRMSIVGLVFLWCIFAIFKILKTRKLLATAISLLMVIPLQILINFTLSKIITETLVDIWDILVFSIVAILVVLLFAWDSYKLKNKVTKV